MPTKQTQLLASQDLLLDLISTGDPIWSQMCADKGGKGQDGEDAAYRRMRRRVLDVLALALSHSQGLPGPTSGSKTGADEEGEYDDERGLDDGGEGLVRSLVLRGFEDGLSFIREVEKGSHLKAGSLAGFRVEAVVSWSRIVEEEVRKALIMSDGSGELGVDGGAELGDSMTEATADVQDQRTVATSITTSTTQDNTKQIHQALSVSRKRLEDTLRQLVHDYRQMEKKAQKNRGKKNR